MFLSLRSCSSVDPPNPRFHTERLLSKVLLVYKYIGVYQRYTGVSLQEGHSIAPGVFAELHPKPFGSCGDSVEAELMKFYEGLRVTYKKDHRCRKKQRLRGQMLREIAENKQSEYLDQPHPPSLPT